MSGRLFVPEETLAIVLGSQDWSAAELPSSHAFLNSASDISDYIRATEGLDIPGRNVLDLFDSERSATEQITDIAKFIRSRTDTAKEQGRQYRDLILYYTGHGAFDVTSNEYMLLVRSTRYDLEYITSINIRSLANCLEQRAPFMRRFMILDCCFAGGAANAFGGGQVRFQAGGEAEYAAKQVGEAMPGRGTLVFCSSSGSSVSKFVDGEEHTMFSGALSHVLTHGAGDGRPFLSFNDLRAAVWDHLRGRYGAQAIRPVLHVPNQQDGDLSTLPAFRNPATSEAAAPAPPVQPPSPAPPRQQPPAPAAEPAAPDRGAVAAKKPMLTAAQVAPLAMGALALIVAVLVLLRLDDRESSAEPPAATAAAAPAVPGPEGAAAALGGTAEGYDGAAAALDSIANQIGAANESNAQTAAMELIDKYWADWSKPNDQAIPALSGYYADRVRYFAGLISRDAVMREKIAFASRFPERAYAMRKSESYTTCSDQGRRCVVNAVVAWSATTAGGARSSGRSRLAFTIEGGKIVAEMRTGAGSNQSPNALAPAE